MLLFYIIIGFIFRLRLLYNYILYNVVVYIRYGILNILILRIYKIILLVIYGIYHMVKNQKSKLMLG